MLAHGRPSTSSFLTAWLPLVGLYLLFAMPAQAASLLPKAEGALAEAVTLIKAEQIEAAERNLDQLPAHERNADYHYLRGVIATEMINDAGMIRAVRLARRIRSHLEDALEVDPDHALSHFGLLQFHRFAPSVIGGRQRELEFHQQRLVELDSYLQFASAIVKAQMEDDSDAELSIYADWIAHSPTMFNAHLGYLSSLIRVGDYERAQQVFEDAMTYAEGEQVQRAQYQLVRMAALYGHDYHEQRTANESSDDSPSLNELAWFNEAYTTGLDLIDAERLALDVDEAWLQLRVAQIEWALGDTQSASARIGLIQNDADDERLRTNIESLNSLLASHSGVAAEPAG